MAQADGVVANGSGAAVRADINTQLAAVFTNHSGATQPSTISAHQWWYDESANILKIRNDANDGWVDVLNFNTAGSEGALGVPVGTAAATSIRPASDADSGFFFRQGTQASYGYGVSYAISGTEWLSIDSTIDGDASSPSFNWRSRDVSINGTTEASAGVQMTQSGRMVIAKDQGWVLGINRMNSTGNAVLFNNNASGGSSATVGTIDVTTSSTSYNTSSDYRLKENVIALTGAKSRLQQLLPKRFNFIVDPNVVVDGFIADEAQSVVPEAVTGTRDEVDSDGSPKYQGIDQSKLVPLLTAALQEAFAEIADLTTRVATLEAG